MAFRTPTADGLLVSPNAVGFGANPAANSDELQNHAYWGRYLDTTFLPNVGTVDGLPVFGANAASSPAFEKLRPGDTAYCEGGTPLTTGNLYMCIDAGTNAGNNAIWITLGDPAGPTIRDAHVIVVAQDAFLNNLADVTIPPLALNGLNLGTVGDIVSVTCDYLDAGNGQEFARALAAAVAGGIPIDIRLRPCDIDFNTGLQLLPLTVAAGCRVIGAGRSLSFLTGRNTLGNNQSMFLLDEGATLEDLTAVSPAPTIDALGAELGVIQIVANFGEVSAQVLRCDVKLMAAFAGQPIPSRVATVGVYVPSPGPYMLVDDCNFYIDDVYLQGDVPTIQSTAVYMGGDTTSAPAFDPEVRNCTVQGGESVRGCPSAVVFRNVEGGRVFNTHHHNAHDPNPSFGWFFDTTTNDTRARAPKFIECSVVTEDLKVGSDLKSQYGFRVNITGAPVATGTGFFGTMFQDCSVEFLGIALAAWTRRGFSIENLATDATVLRDTTLDNCRVRGQHQAFQISAAGVETLGLIISAKVTACQGTDSAFLGGGAQPARGIRVVGSGGQTPNVLNVGIVNCDFYNVANDVTAIACEIANANVKNTIVIGNNLTPIGAGVALADSGLGTEAANNILV